ncbi:MAG: hypothetical protein ABIW33_09505 [Sphingomicrobium sp.]
MVRNLGVGMGAIALLMGASGALAQQAGPEAGSGNAAQSSSASREMQSSYNRVVGNLDKPKTIVTGTKGKAQPAIATDLKPGSGLRDVAGVPIGTVASVDPDGVVVNTGQTKIKVPTIAFGKDDYGLLLPISAARFAELVAKAKVTN